MRLSAETVMYSAGRQGQTDQLDLANAGLESDDRGRIFVDDKTFQTKVDHIYAVGDVIGFPALAATSMEQGRLAAYHAFGEPTAGITALAMDPWARFVVTASTDGTARVWDLSSARPIHVLRTGCTPEQGGLGFAFMFGVGTGGVCVYGWSGKASE